MSFSSKKKQKLFTEINITPLTDIFLVLLIIMMVVAPSFQSMDNAVDVPEVNNGINIENSKVTVSITKDGAMYVNGENVKPSQLTDKLLAAKTDDEKSEVVVKADKAIKSSTIMNVMNAAQNAEYKKLIVAGEPLNKKEQKELEKLKHKYSRGWGIMRETFNEINITPLTDIFLVLLIIMMVIAPLLDKQGISLTVPENVEQSK